MSAAATMWLAGCSPFHHQPLAPAATANCRTTPPSGPSLRWMTPDEPADRRRLDAWCAGVGPALIHAPVVFEERTERVDASAVMFASWNVHVGAGDVERFVADLRAGRFSRGRPVRHFVLMIQEAVRHRGVPVTVARGARSAKRIGATNTPLVDVEDVARKLDLFVLYVPSMRNGPDRSSTGASDRGNAILSTLPLTDPAAVELPGARQRRVAVDACVPLDFDGHAVAFAVSSAHLNVLGPARTLWIFGATTSRAHQASALIGSRPDGPAILGADVNSWQGSDERAVRTLLRAFPNTPVSRTTTFRGGLMLDRMFFRLPANWSAQVTRAPDRYGSDHYPMVGTIARTGY